MALGSTPSRPPVKLVIKPVLLTAVTLCRSHLERYLGLAFKAMLWSLPIGLLFISLMVMLVTNMLISIPQGSRSQVLPQLMPLAASLAPASGWLSLLLIPISIYCLTKALVCNGTIARLAYQDLAGQPESVRVAQSAVISRQWSLLRVIGQVSVYMLVVYFGFVIAGTIIGMIAAGIAVGALRLPPEIAISIAISLVYVLVVAIIVVGCLWVYARWFTAEMPLVVSDTNTGGESLVHNATLVQMAQSQLVRIVFWTGLLTGGLAWVVNTLTQRLLQAVPPTSP